MGSRRQSITSFDVAELAGVSQPTVSRALRNLPGASLRTRARVLAAAEELGYVASESGRALSTRTTRRIAVVSEELTNPYYPELVEPLRRHLAARKLRMVLITDTGDGPIGLAELADGSYDGAILTTIDRRSRLPRDLTERGIPHVLVNRILDQAESPSCAVDNRAGVAALAQLVVDLGHTAIASVQGPTLTSTGRERAEALRRSLRAHGIALPRVLVRRGAFTHADGLAATLDLLEGSPRPTAIVCGNDVIALGALSAARMLGVRVPDELTIVGFDDIQAAAWPLSDLTTVHADLDGLAHTAVDLLAMEIAGLDVEPRVHRFPVRLVERGTHGRVPLTGSTASTSG